MIEYIKGQISELNPAYVIIETNDGLGYYLNISLPTYSELEGATQTRLLVHEWIREDAWNLYGFATQEERNLFRQLVSVSGVGASTAMLILSSFKTPELQTVIASGDAGRLKAVKGIGAKTAQRIIVDLRDKINVGEDTLLVQPAGNGGEVHDEALTAMTILGFPRAAAQKALKKVFDADPTVSVEDAIRRALAMM